MAEVKELKNLQSSEINLQSKEGMVETEQRGQKHEGMVDVGETHARVPAEVKTWMQKIEEDPGQMKTVHDDSGQPLLTPVPNQNPKIILPISRAKFVAGFKKKVNDAGRWLSGFLLRLIKKNQGNVKFKVE